MPGGTPQQPNGSLVEHPLQVWLKEPEIAQSSEPSLFTTLGGCTCPGAQNEVQSESSRDDAFVEPSAASHAVHVRVPPATSQPEVGKNRLRVDFGPIFGALFCAGLSLALIGA